MRADSEPIAGGNARRPHTHTLASLIGSRVRCFPNSFKHARRCAAIEFAGCERLLAFPRRCHSEKRDSLQPLTKIGAVRNRCLSIVRRTSSSSAWSRKLLSRLPVLLSVIKSETELNWSTKLESITNRLMSTFIGPTAAV